MQFLRVANLQKYQHYKERRPPWVKLHRTVFSDYAFSRLQDASKSHLMLLWLLASEYDNKIPNDAEWIGRKIDANTPVNVGELVSAGFLETYEDDSITLAPCLRGDSERGSTEDRGQRTEAEKQKKHLSPPAKNAGAKRGADADFDQLWAIYPKRAGGNPKAAALKAYRARRIAGVTHAELAAGLTRYAAYCVATGKIGTEFVKQAATFFGADDEAWKELWVVPGVRLAPNAPTVTEAADRAHTQRVQLEDRYQGAAHRAGGTWAKANPEAYQAIRDAVELPYRGKTGEWITAAIKAELTQRCAKAAGFPSFDAWCRDSQPPEAKSA